jgi:cytochrome c oxidase accessory protein FixG
MLLEPEDHVLSTLERDGSRRWMWPKPSPGRFLTGRQVLGYSLIALFGILPYVKINGQPAMLLDVIHRKFHLFGTTFLPTDTVLLALGMVSFIVTIFLFTAVLGRLWCGWVCPQTVYMELVFRPIERLCLGIKGRGGPPRGAVAPWRKVLKFVVFFVISIYLAHTFLAYFVGVENLRKWIFGSPQNHPIAFAVMAVTTALMMFDFGYFREQMCILACPYGRFQSVMLDRQSLIISYDHKRGEPRGKMKSGTEQAAAKLGDCIDCKACVVTCPTGIDIRQGLQLECIGCAQCIDACDAIMTKVGRKTGLIRYSSQDAIEGTKRRGIRPRLVFYPAILLVLASFLVFNVSQRQAADVTLLRSAGQPFMKLPTGEISNNLRLKITNRSDRDVAYNVAVDGDASVRIVMNENPVTVAAGEMATMGVVVIAPADRFKAGQADLVLRVTDGREVDRMVKCHLVGPLVMGPVSQGGNP